MQRLFRDAHAPRWPDYPTRIRALHEQGQDSPSALLAEFVEAGRHSLENLATSLDSKALEAAVETLAAARTIHLVGFRRAFPVASYMAYALEKWRCLPCCTARSGISTRATPSSPATPWSRSPSRPTRRMTVELATYARERGIPVIAITDTLASPLRRLDVTALCVSEIDVGAFRALSATLSLATTLVVAIGARRS